MISSSLENNGDSLVVVVWHSWLKCNEQNLCWSYLEREQHLAFDGCFAACTELPDALMGSLKAPVPWPAWHHWMMGQRGREAPVGVLAGIGIRRWRLPHTFQRLCRGVRRPSISWLQRDACGATPNTLAADACLALFFFFFFAGSWAGSDAAVLFWVIPHSSLISPLASFFICAAFWSKCFVWELGDRCHTGRCSWQYWFPDLDRVWGWNPSWSSLIPVCWLLYYLPSAWPGNSWLYYTFQSSPHHTGIGETLTCLFKASLVWLIMLWNLIS